MHILYNLRILKNKYRTCLGNFPKNSFIKIKNKGFNLYKIKFIFIIFLLSLTILNATCTEINDKYYYEDSLSKNNTKCYKYWINSDTIPVFTLKHNTGSNSDFDIHIYDYSDMSKLLDKGINNGKSTELLTLSPNSSYQYVYIKITNAGSFGSFKLYTHQIKYLTYIDKALTLTMIQSGVESILESLFGVNENSSVSDKKNISRGASIVMSSLLGKDLGDTSKDLMINEIGIKAKQEFGYGFWGKVVAKYGTLIVRDIYRYN